MSDKLNKNINESMLEGLLSDEDKPKPPKPVYPSYSGNYGGGHYTNYRSQSNFDWSRGDPMFGDEDEDGYTDQRGRSTYRKPAAPAGGKFIAGGGAVALIKQALDEGLHSGMKHFYLAEKDANNLVKGVVMALGDLFDAVGLCWGANGSKQASAFVYDMLLSNVFYNTPTRGYKELDFGGEMRTDPTPKHDPETGEIIEDNDIERQAIMEVDGGAVVQQGGDND